MAQLFQDGAVQAREKPETAASRDARRDFGTMLAQAARSTLSEARTALADPALSDAQAVHELRKALKRWRALLRLLRPAVGERAEAMRAGARALMRQLSGARDTQAALDALDDLAKGDLPSPSISLQSMRERITARRDSGEGAAFTPDLRARAAVYLDDAEREIDGWTPAHIEFAAVADSLTGTFRRARRLQPQDWRAVAPDALHALRRRVVEHRHQMELIEPLWPRLGKVWAEEAQRLRNHLGACQDLTVLERLTAPHQPLARWRSPLAAAAAARRREHLRVARRLSGRLFAEKPKAFRKRVVALWEARQARKKTEKHGRPEM